MAQLKVLHISTTDNIGGSARAAYRLHLGLKQLGVQSRMLVKEKATRDGDVYFISRGLVTLCDKMCQRVMDRLSLQSLFYPSTFLLTRNPLVREADVVHVCNTHGGYFSHTALGTLSQQRPLVWRLDDMWAMTGNCVFTNECERWLTGCGSCKRIHEYPYLRSDTTHLLWRIKKWVYKRSRLTLVTPSQWLAGEVKKSPLLRDVPVFSIPNGLDTQVYRPVSKAAARELLGLDQHKTIIFFTAYSLKEARKGVKFFIGALNRLSSSWKQNLLILIAGSKGDSLASSIPFAQHYIGFVQDDRMMAAAYSAADLVVAPSRAETFGQVFSEAMACGTPPVGFRNSAVEEVVRHMETGYLAADGDIEDMTKGIELLLGDDRLRTKMSKCGREVAVQEYSLEIQAKRYLDLYERVIGEHRSKK